MSPRLCSLPAALAALGLCLLPAPGMGESAFGAPAAGAALDFRIVIPPVMRVLENSHPDRLDPTLDGALSAEQRLVVVSNLRRGFCVALRLNAPQLAGWQLQASAGEHLTLSPNSGGGYRLCAHRAGRYTLLLRHQFEADGALAALHWPVQTELMAL